MGGLKKNLVGATILLWGRVPWPDVVIEGEMHEQDEGSNGPCGYRHGTLRGRTAGRGGEQYPLCRAQAQARSCAAKSEVPVLREVGDGAVCEAGGVGSLH